MGIDGVNAQPAYNIETKNQRGGKGTIEVDLQNGVAVSKNLRLADIKRELYAKGIDIVPGSLKMRPDGSWEIKIKVDPDLKEWMAQTGATKKSSGGNKAEAKSTPARKKPEGEVYPGTTKAPEARLANIGRDLVRVLFGSKKVKEGPLLSKAAEEALNQMKRPKV